MWVWTIAMIGVLTIIAGLGMLAWLNYTEKRAKLQKSRSTE